MEVTLLTQDECAFCEHAKTILERLAAEYGFSLRTMDTLSVEGQRLVQQGGVMFPPGIFIDGEAISYGRPSERRLRRELDIRGRPEGQSRSRRQGV